MTIEDLKKKNNVRIKLDNTNYILADQHQWILAKINNSYDKNNSKSSEFIPVGYFTNVCVLLKRYVDDIARQSNIKSLYELRETIKSISIALHKTSLHIQIDVSEVPTNNRGGLQ